MKSKKPVIKAVIFDLGNVLVNYDVFRALRRLARLSKVSEKKLALFFFFSPLEKAYTLGKISSRRFYEEVRHKLGIRMSFEAFRACWNDIFWENKGMRELLAKLKKRYPLYLISNTNEMHFEYIRKKYGVLKHFRRTFPSHKVGARKPGREIFEKALRVIKQKPEEVIFIDDMPAFIRGAKRLGMNAVRFRNRSQLERELARYGVEIPRRG